MSSDVKAPNVIAVLGPARSGSSCTAGILHALGVSMGRYLLPANPMNSKGFFESMDLRRLLAHIFRGSPINGFRSQIASSEIVKAFRRHMDFRKDDGNLLGVKHPWLCMLISEMAEAWPGLKIVSINRDLDAVVSSMKGSQKFPNDNEEQRRNAVMQLVTMRDADSARLNIPTLTLNYADILADPTKAVNDLIAFAGINPTQEQIGAAVAFVEPELCHH